MVQTRLLQVPAPRNGHLGSAALPKKVPVSDVSTERTIAPTPVGLEPPVSLKRPSRDRQSSDQVLMTEVGLRIPASLSFEDWERAGYQLSRIVNSSLWCLGDWLVYGKKTYTDRYMRAIRAAGLRYQTLRNYAWVSRRFEWNRRRHQLTFQHHAEVASMPVEKQEMWLDEAERQTWTTKQLRAHIKDQREERDREPASPIPRIEVLRSRLDLWRKAADCTGTKLDDWMLGALDRAAEEILSES
jgi:hypothetical protein